MSMGEKNIGFYHLKDAEKKAFQDLRRNIQYCNIGSRLKTIAVTSCLPGEGKSITAKKLSIAMAETGLRVLLIDADLWKKGTQKELLKESKAGLTNLLAGSAPIQETIQTTGLENLSFMASGPILPNSTDLIEQKSLLKILSDCKESYDMILIDTPPLARTVDGAIIAAQTDGVILVVRYNKTRYKNVLRAKESLEKMNARILGVVLNRIKNSEYRRMNCYGKKG